MTSSDRVKELERIEIHRWSDGKTVFHFYMLDGDVLNYDGFCKIDDQSEVNEILYTIKIFRKTRRRKEIQEKIMQLYRSLADLE